MDSNLDINLVIQSFQEKVAQLTVELVVKDATIKQLTDQIKQIKKTTLQSSQTSLKDETDVEYNSQKNNKNSVKE